ncbi:DUF4350 domain-containing protein [Streptomyces iconiensis]|uniref:DUF4350 domain-containing protein n=1 Tax=Streptomyces iconiensis TaxID=1384038 RepID=A0ABT7ACU5_9ACTN|nr:DUF4350 domain-containing protein [Streptomyces iconiensis]MDJ1138433.1 DUF4350 domain-containing protein [Streptomyces iconiensis]
MSASTTTSTSPTAHQLWHRARGLLLAAAILAVAGVTIAALRSGGEHGLLDPRSADPYGSKAVSRLLSDRGIHTKVLTSSTEILAQTDPATTLLVPAPDSLNERQRDEIRRAALRSGRTVLVAPGADTASALAPGVRTASPTPVQPVLPGCDFPAARRAGNVDLGGFRYSAKTEQADSCYLRQGKGTLLRLPTASSHGSSSAPTRDTVLLGAPDLLYNDHLANRGNASLAVQLLGSRSQLLWYLPNTSDTAAPEGEERSFFDLLPSGWTWAAVQLAVAVALAALWRARRLGPLVQEQLPVAVPAAEATEGRARLYRKANARAHAATSLRSASRTRLARLVGVSHSQAHTPDILVSALAERTRGGSPPTEPERDSSSIHSLLFGPPPQNDAALVQLADALDQFEKHVTSDASAPPPRDKDRPT